MGKESTGKPKPKPFVDLEVRGHFTPEDSVAESSLSTAVQEKLGPFTTEEALLMLQLASARRKNLYLAKIANMNPIRDSDIKWPV